MTMRMIAHAHPSANANHANAAIVDQNVNVHRVIAANKKTVHNKAD